MHTVKGIMIIKTKVNTYKTDITKKNKQLNKICDKLRNTKTNPQLKILSEKKCKVPKEIHLSMHLLLHQATSYIQPKTLA